MIPITPKQGGAGCLSQATHGENAGEGCRRFG